MLTFSITLFSVLSSLLIHEILQLFGTINQSSGFFHSLLAFIVMVTSYPSCLNVICEEWMSSMNEPHCLPSYFCNRQQMWREWFLPTTYVVRVELIFQRCLSTRGRGTSCPGPAWERDTLTRPSRKSERKSGTLTRWPYPPLARFGPEKGWRQLGEEYPDLVTLPLSPN